MQNGLRLVGEFRRDDNLAENLRNRLGTLTVQRLIHRNNTTKGCLIIGRKGLVPSLAQIRPLPHAAGVGVLENGECGRVALKFTNQVRRRRGIQDVVVGKRLAM